jgi:hypothetical protein
MQKTKTKKSSLLCAEFSFSGHVGNDRLGVAHKQTFRNKEKSSVTNIVDSYDRSHSEHGYKNCLKKSVSKFRLFLFVFLLL